MSLRLERVEPPAEHPRLPTWVFRGVVLLLFGILCAQLWKLQIVDGRAYVSRSAANTLRTAVIPPERGVIFDREMHLLASNAPVFVVSITLADVPSGRLEETMIRVANELRIPPLSIAQAVEKYRERVDFTPFSPIPVRTGVDRDAVLRLGERLGTLQGVQISVDSARKYADGPLFAHLMGYMGAIGADDIEEAKELGYGPDDRMGAAGLEQQYEQLLRGAPGRRLYQVEVTGQEVGELRREPARAGSNLQLTLDTGLQRDVMQILEEGLAGKGSGAAIVMDPRNGQVLAMVSTPTFDNNIIGDPSREDELQQILTDTVNLPMFPRAYAANWSPGSVFKLVVGSGALQEGVANRDTIIDSKGVMYVDSEEYPGVRVPFRDNAAWGRQNFLQGLANSSNIYFFWLGGGYREGGSSVFEGLGVERLAQYARAFGYGSRTGLDVPGEKSGVIPDPAWKLEHKGERWYTGDTYNMSIGQGDVLATPIQVANVTSAIANGGTLYQPHVLHAELNAAGDVVRTFQPKSRDVGVSPENLALMREAMAFAFDGPHLEDFRVPGLRAGGKTGTAEYGGPLDANGNLPTHGWFTSFAPADNPVVTVTVFVEKGGGSDASPIGARILARYFNLSMDPPADTTEAPSPPQRAGAPSPNN